MIHQSRRRAFLIALALTASLSLGGSASAGEPALEWPSRTRSSVVIYLHPEVKDRRFVAPLVCALERVLVAPVAVQDLALPFGPDLFVNRTQLAADLVLSRFWNAVSGDGDRRTVKELIVTRDLKQSPYRYVFAVGGALEAQGGWAQVVSTARFDPLNFGVPGGDPALLAQRLYKSILRSVVHSAGHFEMTGCVMAFPRSLDEHDAKPPTLCPADHAALVAEGVLRAHEKESCEDFIARHDSPAHRAFDG